MRLNWPTSLISKWIGSFDRGGHTLKDECARSITTELKDTKINDYNLLATFLFQDS